MCRCMPIISYGTGRDWLLILFFLTWMATLNPGAGFTKPTLERTSFSKGRLFLFLWEGHLKIQFHKASFNSPYQRPSLKFMGGANVH